MITFLDSGLTVVVVPDGCPIGEHPVRSEPTEPVYKNPYDLLTSLPTTYGEIEVCRSELKRWGFGDVCYRGYCSPPCEHGWVFRTEDFPEELARAFATLHRHANKERG